MLNDILNNTEKSRYEITLEGHTAVADYRIDGQVMTIPHVGVPGPLEGKGVGSALVKYALEDARIRGLKVRPTCSFAAAYVQRHKEYGDVIA